MWQKKQKKNYLPSARSQGSRQIIFKKNKNKKPFAESLTSGHSAKADGRWPPSRRAPLPTAKFYRVPGTRQRFFCRRPLSAKAYLPTAYLCRVPLGPALGKDCLCRVPDKKCSANCFALGKSAVSSSACVVYFRTWRWKFFGMA